MAWTPPTSPEDSYALSPFGFGPFPLPGMSVSIIPPHPMGGGYGGVGFLVGSPDNVGGTPYGLGSFGARSFGRPPVNISGGYGGDPYGLSGYGSLEKTSPFVSSVVSISGFEVEVFFSEEMDTSNSALTDPASYSLTAVSGAAPATVVSVHLEQLGSVNLQAGKTIAGALSVIVTHSGTTLGGTYTLQVSSLTDISGNVVVGGGGSFLARGTPPVFVASIPTPNTGNQVLVTFDQPMLTSGGEPGSGPGISDVESYIFEPTTPYPIDLVALSANHLADPKKVLLSVQGMTSLEYALTVGPSFAFSYDPVNGLDQALRLDTGTGTAVESTQHLVLSRLRDNAFGLEWQDISGSISPLVSTLRMDFRYDLRNVVYDPPIALFSAPQVFSVLFQDGTSALGIKAQCIFQYNSIGGEEIRVVSGTFGQTYAATWSGGPHTLSLVRNQKAGTLTVLLDDFPLTSTLMGNFDGTPETQAGIRCTLLNGGWDLSGFRILSLRATSSTTVYSQAWNFLHEGNTLFEGSSFLTKDSLYTKRGPLVKDWGDATPATKQDVSVRVNGVSVEISSVNPYLGVVKTVVPIPLLPPNHEQASVQVDYQWIKSPIMEFTGLNTPGLVLNKYDCGTRGHHDPASHGDQIQSLPLYPKGAVDIHRFPMGVVLGPFERAQPLHIGHRYVGFERAQSALTNSPTTLLLNQAPNRVSVPGFERVVEGVSVAYEGVVRPQDAVPSWGLVGTDFGGVDHSVSTGIDLGTYTLIDGLLGSFNPSNPQTVVYRRGVDLTHPNSIYLVVRFQLSGSNDLFDAYHPNPGGANTTSAVTDGVFTGVGFGIHDNHHLYLCGILKVNGLEHVGLLLDPKRPHEATSWSIGPKALFTAQSQNHGFFVTSQVPTGFTTGSRFQILLGSQQGVYTATSVTAQTNGTSTVEISPALPESWDLWGNKYPEVTFETRASSKPFTYRMDINSAQQVAEIRVSGETQGVVVSLDGNVPALPTPATTSLLIPMDGFGQMFWGSLSRQAANRSTWSFARYGIVPDQVFLQGHAITVNTEMSVLPENDPNTIWFPRQAFGTAAIVSNEDELLLKSCVASDTLDFSFGYSRVEPFLSPKALLDIQFLFSVDSGVCGSGDVEVSFDDTQRVVKLVPLLYQEGFSGQTTYRRLINLPSVSFVGVAQPETLGWSTTTGSTLDSQVKGSQLLLVQTPDNIGGWRKNLDWASLTNTPQTDEGRLFEARLAVLDHTTNGTFDTGLRFGCHVPTGSGNAVVQVELRSGPTPGIRLRSATGSPVEEYDFDWVDSLPHTYRVVADRNASTVTLIVDDIVLLPVASLGDFSGATDGSLSFFGCFGVNGSNDHDDDLTCVVEVHSFHSHVLPPSTSLRTLGVWLGGDPNDINAFEIPRTDSSTNPNSWASGPIIEPMDWRSRIEVRLLRDPEWGVTVYRPDEALPPYYTPENGSPGSGFITQTTEPSAGWINVEYQNLPRSPGTNLGLVNFGSLNSASISQSRWDWVRYRLFLHPTEDRIAPQHMLLNQFNVITSGELTRNKGLEQVALVTLDRYRLTLLPTHLYAQRVYKVLDGDRIWTSEDWVFDPVSQTLTLQQNMQTGEEKVFSSEHANVDVFFVPGFPVTNTFLLNQPLSAGITTLNEGTPPVPKSQTAESEIEVVFGSGLNDQSDLLNDDQSLVLNDPYQVLKHKDVEGSLYESLDFFEVTNGGDTGLISFVCDGGPGTGLSGFSPNEGEPLYSPEGEGDSLGGSGNVSNHFATGEVTGLAVGAEVFAFSGSSFWENASFAAVPDFQQDSSPTGGFLFASGGAHTNPLVDGQGNILAGHRVPGGGLVGGGTFGAGALTWPSYPSRGPVGGDQGRIYKRTDWLIQINPSDEETGGLNPKDEYDLEGADSTTPGFPSMWSTNPGVGPNPLGAPFVSLQTAGDYSRFGPWGGLDSLTPTKSSGTFRVVVPVDGDQVGVLDPVTDTWVLFTARTVPLGPQDFALAPNPHIALAEAINAYTFSVGITAEAGLTLSGVPMVRVSAEDAIPFYPPHTMGYALQTVNPSGFALADVHRIPGNIGIFFSGAGVKQSSLAGGGNQLGTVTDIPDLFKGMVAGGGVALPQGSYIRVAL